MADILSIDGVERTDDGTFIVVRAVHLHKRDVVLYVSLTNATAFGYLLQSAVAEAGKPREGER
jgi:hypothetical protein